MPVTFEVTAQELPLYGGLPFTDAAPPAPERTSRRPATASLFGQPDRQPQYRSGCSCGSAHRMPCSTADPGAYCRRRRPSFILDLMVGGADRAWGVGFDRLRIPRYGPP